MERHNVNASAVNEREDFAQTQRAKDRRAVRLFVRGQRGRAL